MKLRKITSLEVVPVSPFNFDTTFKKPDHFTSGDNIWEPGVRWQTWQWEGKCLGSDSIDNLGKINQLLADYYR